MSSSSGSAGSTGLKIPDRKSTRLNSRSRPHLVCRLLLESRSDPRALHSFPTRRSSDLDPGRTGPSNPEAARQSLDRVVEPVDDLVQQVIAEQKLLCSRCEVMDVVLVRIGGVHRTEDPRSEEHTSELQVTSASRMPSSA